MNKKRLIDLDVKQYDMLQKIIAKVIPDKEVWAYGSRITWKAEETSDLDLVVFDCNLEEICTLKEEFEESDLLIAVDVLRWKNIPENFKTNIKKKHVALQKKSKLDGWRNVKLKEIAEIKSGKRNSQDATKHGKYPLFDSSQIIKKSDHYLFEDTAVIVAGEGKEFIPRYYHGKFDLHQRSYAIFNFKNQVESKWIYYYLLNKKSYFSSVAVGSTVLSLRLNHFQNFPILLPPLHEQKAITEVLSSLDEKIELLHLQNKILENMSQTFFRKLFIDNPKKSTWKIIRFGKILENFDSKRIPVARFERDKMKVGQLYPYYGAAQILDYINDYIFEGEYILMAEDGTVKTSEGYPILQYASGRFWVNNHTHVLLAKLPYNNHFIWHFLLNLNIENIVTGAVQQKISQANLNSIKFPVPPTEIVNHFQTQMDPFFEKFKINKKQIHILKNLRDILLSKLMNRTVRINS